MYTSGAWKPAQVDVVVKRGDVSLRKETRSLNDVTRVRQQVEALPAETPLLYPYVPWSRSEDTSRGATDDPGLAR
jgi:hypothetical protein